MPDPQEVTRYFFDTEFIENGSTIKLLSIGIVCEDDRTFYAETTDVDWGEAGDWVWENVIPHLNLDEHGMTRKEIADQIVQFVSEGDGRPEFWAYYGSYDWVVLCQLYGRMIDLPEGWPMFPMDVKQMAVELGNPKLPEQSSTEHHALADAEWTRDAWQYLMDRRKIQL